jgi:hypothetical protein
MLSRSIRIAFWLAVICATLQAFQSPLPDSEREKDCMRSIL